MMQFAAQNGNKKFGFEDGSTYCAKFAADVIRAGGGNIKEWDLNPLIDKANKLIEDGIDLRDTFKIFSIAAEFIDQSPTPKEIAKNIGSNYPKYGFKKLNF